MYTINLNQAVIFSLLLHVSHGQRRIVNGENVSEPKRYVVYLVEARISPIDYDEWLCGGALVTPEFIVTSAACVEDVKHLYVIAGYDKYVTKEELYKNPCTSKTKKKIVLTCVPKSYELNYEKLEKWSFIDIAVAKVESPYNFEDKDFATLCTYTPQTIEINFETKYQVEGVDAIALGWGHKIKWRSENDTKTYNNVMLQYTPILIADKEKCKKEYENYKGMSKVIDTYMICSIEAGNIDSKGALRAKSKPTANGCPGHEGKIEQLMGFETNNECEPAEEPDDMAWVENTRRQSSNNDTTSNDKNNLNTTETHEMNIDNTTTNINSIRAINTRRNGICQNDHGGPIVTWIGSEEYLIAVASVFKVSKDMECTGPFLYTSTECNGAFLACVLGLEKNEETRRAMCDIPSAERGFDTIETHISWRNHPDGFSESERVNASLITKITTLAAKIRKPEDEISYRSSDNKQDNESSTNTTIQKVTSAKSIQHIDTGTSATERLNVSSINTKAILS